MIDQWSILAGLRFFLALVVAVTHLKPSFAGSQGGLSWIASFGAFEAIVGFLVISGYSVGGSFVKGPEGYLRRRFQRIYPIYVFSILLTITVFCWHLGNPIPSWSTMGWNLCFLNQVFTSNSFVGPAWTLALEVWLYCLCPLLLRQDPATLRLLCFGSFACYALYSFCRSGFHFPYYSDLGGGLNLIFLSYAWLAGLRIADPRCDRASSLRDLLVLLALVPGIETMVQVVSHGRRHEWSTFFKGDIVTAAAHLALLLAIWIVFRFPSRAHRRGGITSIVLRFLGDVSYPLYLLHYAIYTYLSSRGCHDPGMLTASAVLCSALVYLCLDRYSQKRHLGLSTS
jgi:peptidoglycan/LPS O-acetylase OafA/YrhL